MANVCPRRLLHLASSCQSARCRGLCSGSFRTVETVSTPVSVEVYSETRIVEFLCKDHAENAVESLCTKCPEHHNALRNCTYVTRYRGEKRARNMFFERNGMLGYLASADYNCYNVITKNGHYIKLVQMAISMAEVGACPRKNVLRTDKANLVCWSV